MASRLAQLIEEKDYLSAEELIESLPSDLLTEEGINLLLAVVKFIPSDLPKEIKTYIFLEIVESGHVPVMESLVQLGWTISDYFNNYVIIFSAVKSNNPAMLKLILDSGYNLFQIFDCKNDGLSIQKFYGRHPRKEENRRALSKALKNNNIEMVNLLLNAGWKIRWDIEDSGTTLNTCQFETAILILEAATADMGLILGDHKFKAMDHVLQSPDRVRIYEWMRDHGWPLKSCVLSEVFTYRDYRDVLPIFLSKTPKGARWLSIGYNEIMFESLLQLNAHRQYELRRDFHKEMFELFISTVETEADLRGIKRLHSLVPGLEGCERTLPL